MAEETVRVLRIEVGDSQKTVKGLRKDVAELRDTLLNLDKGTEAYEKTVAELAAKENELKSVMSATKATADAAEGSYAQLQQRMKQLRAEWRATGDDAKRAALGQEINKINGQLKAYDKTIGDSYRNVGNYTSIWDKFGGGLTKVMGAVGLAIGGGVAAFRTLDSIMQSTQATGDRLNMAVAGWRAGWDLFVRSIASGDFSNFINGANRAMEAGRNLQAVLDNSFELNNQAKLLGADYAKELAEQEEILKDIGKTDAERLAAGQRILDITEEKNKSILASAKEIADAQWGQFAAQTEIAKADEEYAKSRLRTWYQDTPLREEAQKYLDIKEAIRLLRQEGAATAPAIAELKEELQTIPADAVEYATRFYSAYQKGNDELVKNVVESTVELANAETATWNTQRRTITQMNNLKASGAKATADAAKKAAEEAKKAREETQREIDGIFGTAFNPSEMLSKIQGWYEAGYITMEQYAKGMADYSENESVMPNIMSVDNAGVSKLIDDRIKNNAKLVKADEKAEKGMRALTQKQVKETQDAEEEKTAAKKMGVSATAEAAGNLSTILGEETAAGKAFAIAQATISTYQAGAEVLASQKGPLWTRIAAMTAIITAGLAQVKQIVSVSPNGSVSGGSGTGGYGMTPPAFVAAPVTYTRNIQTEEEIDRANTTPVVKAYVVEGELTDAQRKALARKKNSTF